MSTFDLLVEDLIDAEGGAEITNDPQDKGGLTKFGISQKAYPNVDIAALTEDEAKKIYKKDYWDKFKLGNMPEQYRRDIFFNVVNSGSSAIRDIQQALGAAVDGKVGPETLGKLENFDGDLTRTIKEGQIKRYVSIAKSNPDQRKFLNGWINRAVGQDRFSARTEDLRSLSPEEIETKAMSALDKQSNEGVFTPDRQPTQAPESLSMGYIDNIVELVRSRLEQPQRASQAPSRSDASSTSQQAGSSRGRTEEREQQLERTANEAQLEADAREAEEDKLTTEAVEFTAFEQSLIDDVTSEFSNEPDGEKDSDIEFTPFEQQLIEYASGTEETEAPVYTREEESDEEERIRTLF